MDTLMSSVIVLNHTAGWEHGEYWWIGRLGMLLFLIVLIGLLFWWMRRNAWRHHEPSGVERARGILAERFARGEIDAEEYRERLSQLV
jgi:putative membrane protein